MLRNVFTSVIFGLSVLSFSGAHAADTMKKTDTPMSSETMKKDDMMKDDMKKGAMMKDDMKKDDMKK